MLSKFFKKKNTEESTLGLFWGAEALFFTENKNSTISNSFNIPFKHKQLEDNIPEINSETGSLELVSLIQHALNQNNIRANSINLSLPTKDIIFRSFVSSYSLVNCNICCGVGYSSLESLRAIGVACPFFSCR